MASPYIGEIRQWAGNFAPVGWLNCDGSLVAINDYDTLFNLIGTTYGGDGQRNFGLPNLQSRVPVHQGSGFQLGQMADSEQVTVVTAQLPPHTHVPVASSSAGNSDTPKSNVWAAATNATPYAKAPGTENLNQASIGMTGGSLSHENRIPFQAITYIIAYTGIYPTPS